MNHGPLSPAALVRSKIKETFNGLRIETRRYLTERNSILPLSVPKARVCPSGLNSTVCTPLSPVVNVRRSVLEATSHSLAEPSRLPEASVRLSGVNERLERIS